MRRTKTLQTNFSAGELAPEMIARSDVEQYRNGAKTLLNYRCLIGGGVTRRPGLRYLHEFDQPQTAIEFTVNPETLYVLCFSTGQMRAFLTDGTAAGTVTGAPWAFPEEMDWAQRFNTLFLFHPAIPPQILTRTGAASWSRASMTFKSGPGGRTEQPYYKVVDDAVTLAPSALTGSITLTTSAAAFVTGAAGHNGTIWRYLGREILITAVLTATTATGTVLQTLAPTQALTVSSSANFLTGEVVLGDDTGAKGLVTGVPDATHLTVVIIQGLTQFAAEDLIGPNGLTTISAVASAAPAAVTDWDEQLFSSVNGYPACGALHRNRLIMAGHPAISDAIMASKSGDLYSHDLGIGGDADAIFETISDGGATRIVQMHSGEQLLIGTDHGLYYCPESQASPFRASNMAFLSFGSPWPINARVKARSFDDGVLWVSGSLAIMARPTGNLTQSWGADEVSLLSSHIIDNPTRLGVTSNFNGGPERYALLVNDDGTIAAVQLVAAQRIRNVTPWQTTAGGVASMATLGAQVFVTTTRLIAGVNRFFLEVYDHSLTLDLCRTYTDLNDVPADWGTQAVNVVTGRFSLGTYPPTDFETLPAGPYTVGLDFTTLLQPLAVAIEDNEGSQIGEWKRITESSVNVLSSARFAQNGYELAAYQVTDDQTAAPPLRSGWQRFQFMGWSRDPQLSITQPDPLPLTILSMKNIVVYR